jgi:DNA-damage-inducible protein J
MVMFRANHQLGNAWPQLPVTMTQMMICFANVMSMLYIVLLLCYSCHKEVIHMATLTKDTNFNMRMNRQKKSDLEALYSRLGMTLPEAVNIFFENSLLVGGIPFDVRLPRFNRETEAAIQEARDIMSGKADAKSYSSSRELFDDLDAE